VEALLDGSELAHGDTLCLMSGRFLQEDTTDPTGDALTPGGEILKLAPNGDLVAIVNVTQRGPARRPRRRCPTSTVVAPSRPA
jgi:hypothetical protein